jgi:hypothetical protein
MARAHQQSPTPRVEALFSIAAGEQNPQCRSLLNRSRWRPRLMHNDSRVDQPQCDLGAAFALHRWCGATVDVDHGTLKSTLAGTRGIELGNFLAGPTCRGRNCSCILPCKPRTTGLLYIAGETVGSNQTGADGVDPTPRSTVSVHCSSEIQQGGVDGSIDGPPRAPTPTDVDESVLDPAKVLSGPSTFT